MPASLTILFRTVIVIGLSVHVFMMYGTARTMRETFGFDLTTTAIASIFAFFLMLPFVWAVMLADVPTMVAQSRARRRFQRGACPSCGYQLAASGATTCSECGNAMLQPAVYQMSAATLRRFLLLNIAALLVGIVASETWLLLDEHQFRSEVAATMRSAAVPVTTLSRGRTAPFGNASMIYQRGRGFSSTD